MSTKKREPGVALYTDWDFGESGSPDTTKANVGRAVKGRKVKVITLEIVSNLPPPYRPSPIKGELVGEGSENYLVKDPLGITWMVPKHRWRVIKKEVMIE
jgi:hypothetical protein